MRSSTRKKTLFITYSAMIAALYVVLTVLSNTFGLASNVIQCRLSEALCILPFFTPAAIPGLFIGCLLANLLTGCVIWDVIFGSLATLIGALLAYAIRKHKYLITLPTILANILIVPFILRYAYDIPDAIPYLMATVGIGEIISAGILGTMLLLVLNKYKQQLFGRLFY